MAIAGYTFAITYNKVGVKDQVNRSVKDQVNRSAKDQMNRIPLQTHKFIKP